MMEKKLLSPKELLELHIRQEEEAKILAAKLEEENKLEEKSKRILSPKDLFAPEIELSETEEVAEIVEEPKDPVEVLQERIEEVSASIKEPKYYDKEISQVNTVIEQIKNNLQSVPEVKYYDAEIQSILEKLDSLDIRKACTNSCRRTCAAVQAPYRRSLPRPYDPALVNQLAPDVHIDALV